MGPMWKQNISDRQILSMEHSYFPNWEQENKVNLEEVRLQT